MQRHRQEPAVTIDDRATRSHHLCCKNATCVAVVRRCCQRSLASRRDGSTAHQSHATGQCTCRSSRVAVPVPAYGSFVPRCETRRIACMHFSTRMRHVSHTNTYPLPWPGVSERSVARNLLIPRTRVDRLERMPFLSQSTAGQTCV
jgi:hypothetical protein